VDLTEIKKFMEYMDKHELSHFELSRGEDSITLKKKGPEAPAPVQGPPAYPQQFQPMAAPPTADGSTAGGADASNDGVADTDASPRNYIDSPMVGTFYRSPDPESGVFVKPGDIVEEDTTVCIIESMKVMNEIKAERRGKIIEAVAGDSTAVQYGEHLFLIEPA